MLLYEANSFYTESPNWRQFNASKKTDTKISKLEDELDRQYITQNLKEPD